MSKIVKSVLQDELERSRALRAKYEQKLCEYPPGYLLKRRLRGKVYYYLSYRDGEKIRQKYLGVLDKEQVQRYEKQMREKRHIRKQCVAVKMNIRYLERLVKK